MPVAATPFLLPHTKFQDEEGEAAEKEVGAEEQSGLDRLHSPSIPHPWMISGISQIP